MKMKKISIALAALAFSLCGVSVASASFRVVQTPTYHLYTGESGTATTMRITPFPRDLDNVKLTMTDFGTLPTVTVDPKLSGIEEIESFTGITDNGDNTATLTGVSRDLQSKYPYTGTGTGRTHGSGATVVFGNNPQIYGRLAAPENTQTWTAIQTFSVSPIVPTPTTATQAANKSYVDGVVAAGCANGSETVNGCVQLATGIQAASSTSAGSTGGRLALPASLATSSNDVVGLHVVVTQNSGKINWNMIDLGTSFTATGFVQITGGLFATTASTTNATSTNLTVTGNSIGTTNAFGDGSDGSATISSGTTTLTSDKYYTNLTISAGAALVPAGFRVFVNNTLTVAGAIQAYGTAGGVGGNASVSTGGSAGSAGASLTSATGTLAVQPAGVAGGAGNGSSIRGGGGGGGSGAPGGIIAVYAKNIILSGAVNVYGGPGGVGGTGAAGVASGGASNSNPQSGASGVAGLSTTVSYSGNGKAGGTGGTAFGFSGGSAAGGAGGAAGATITTKFLPRNITDGAEIFDRQYSSLVSGAPGSGGGGGGSSGGSATGGGAICDGAGGGGGGGGNGGTAILLYTTLSNSGSINVGGGSAGAAGAGGGTVCGTTTGSAGTAGSTGSSYLITI